MNNPNSNNNNVLRPLPQLLRYTSFQRVFDEVQRLQRLQYLFRHALDNELSQHCAIAQLQAGCLKLVVNTAAWASRVRYTTPMLIASLRKIPEFHDLQKIECKVDPNGTTAPVAPNEPRTITHSSMQLIADTATYIKDPALKEILLKLAHKEAK